jgi:alkylation response protein AidB-like acyl-CoA dehydrogenase
VANIQATAVRSKDSNGLDCFIVNGEKKWITNGMWADYFVVAGTLGYLIQSTHWREWNEWDFTLDT